jgi:hypothetical protein
LGPGRERCLKELPTLEAFKAQFAKDAQRNIELTRYTVCQATGQANCPKPPEEQPK